MTSKMRKSTKPASAPDQPIFGMKASVISIPTTSSITIGPGIDAAEVALGGRAGPDAGGEQTDDQADLDDRRLRSTRPSA